ncbi:hypothetical protein H9L21_09490 [Aeromicrobium senzhongii]|uniref:Uncharacterized protein n=1 Tax=Aeromicrobium senzhongii TaxID=2663859 RepID=A0ABX6SPQ8_9ACTN|nr:hypothetical protein [Aeromicrobium senzhongii]MTB86798.1 hypothetical protein [Aeromicrobium senzhongii]QNL93361.1 hypothetical protein H9L21_09490 [Aeromicrobium senzhongii]
MRRTAILVLLVLGLTACTSESSPEPSGPTVLSLDSVPELTVGEDYDVVTLVPTRIDGRAASLAGWTADGTEILERHAHSADGDPKGDDPYAVALVARDPKTGRTTVVSDRARRQGQVARDRIPGNALQIVSTVVAGDLVAWFEIRGNGPSGDLYVHDMGAGTERRLVRSVAHASETGPVIHGEHVYFVGIDGDDPQRLPARTSVYRVPVDGSREPELVAAGATDVFGDQSVLAPAEGMLQVALEDRVVDWDPERGAEGEVDGTELPADCGVSAGEGVTVACAGEPQELTIDTGDRRFVVTGASGRFAWLEANGRWVRFTIDDDGDQTQYVFDVIGEKLLRVPASRNLRGLQTTSYFLGVLASWDPYPTEPVIEFVR